MNLLQRWQEFKPVRSAIEDVFKLAKSFVLRKFHRYTGRSMKNQRALSRITLKNKKPEYKPCNPQ